MNDEQLKRWMEKRRQRKESLTKDQLMAGILSGDLSALSSAITLLESNLAKDKATAKELVSACLPHTGKSVRVGITGVPGVGKVLLLSLLVCTCCKKTRR